MTKKEKRGFTLIELLVVVLIIGILAAVAVPQYQKAVEKSKAAQAITLLKTLKDAELRYFLANGIHATSFQQLDVQIPFTGNTRALPAYSYPVLSNQEWSILWMGGAVGGVYITRLTGPFQGSGFVFLFEPWGVENTSLYMENYTLACTEKTQGKSDETGITFNKKQGSFCRKVMGSTERIQSGSFGYYYNMP